MNSRPSLPPTVSHASSLFSEFARRVREGESLTIDAFCAAHQAEADELREHHAIHQALARSLETAALVSREKADAAAEALLASYQGRRVLFSSRYQIEGKIDSGGMGAILKAVDRDVGREVAIKIIKEQSALLAGGRRAQPSRDTLARFLNEARITGQLEHPAIVPVHEIGVDDEGRPFFAMKLVHGRHLGEVLREVGTPASKWTRERVLDVLLRACEALAYAHEKEIIHRDLKPSNVMVGDFGEVYVMDWGLAKRLGAPEPVCTERDVPIPNSEITDAAQTAPGTIMGTAYYMSPEQASGDRSRMGPQADVYAVGAMLYELLAKRPPFHRDDESSTPTAIRERLSRWELEPLPNEGVPPELQSICMKAMSREVLARYRDIRELASDLRAFLDGRVVKAYETGTWAETKKWVQRNKALAIALGVVCVTAVGGTVLVRLQANETQAANTKLSDTNTQLTAQTQLANEKSAEAARNAEEAARNAKSAQESAALAQRSADEATKKTRDVLSLSAIQDLQDLVDEADRLWPAHPENLAAYEAWLGKARVLIEGRAGDEALGVSPKPSQADHEAKLAELEALALPQTEEERERDRASHPRAAEFAVKRAQAQWMARMLGKEAWPSAAEVEAGLGKDAALPTDANGLKSLAWPLVNPDLAMFGREVEALILAHRAVDVAKESEKYTFRDTVAWALFRNGQFDEALAEENKALAEAPEKEKQAYAGYVKKLEMAVKRWRDPSGKLRESRTKEWTELAGEVADLERDLSRRRDWTFASGEDRWWHVQLTNLVRDLQAFTDEPTGGLYSSGVSAAHSWGIVKRAEFARTIEERSVSGPEAKKRWSEALAAIATSAEYRKARWAGGPLEPQIGLLPIGADPASGLWEFAHLMSGDEPERGADGAVKRDSQGRHLLRPETCIVLVLTPGGTFTMGAQKDDPTAPNHDPNARVDETPHEVTLSAYFVSKYEMTQGQWERLSGRNPSQYGPQRYSPRSNAEGKGWSALHPVEQVTWTQCMELMERAGLALPSEAQWEHAARAGSSSVYWSGDDLASLAGVANLSDAYGKRNGNESFTLWEPDHDDGNSAHAEVGSYRANAFGLHDVHGNLWEWCLDGFDPRFYGTGPKIDPVSPWSGASYRVYRGGSFSMNASFARSAVRFMDSPGFQFNILGLRPARASRLATSRPHLPVR